MFGQLRTWAGALKRDVLAVWIAARDPRVPWYVKALAILVAAYALSPIDLIPDFIPVFGYLDDVIIVPLGILLVVRLIPAELMEEFRATAALQVEQRPKSTIAAAVVVLLWVIAIVFVLWWLFARQAV